ncbi:MAG: ATP-dependent Clp protease proteolytic subunit [Cetobacterium sp.]
MDKKTTGRTLYLYLHDEVSDLTCQPLIEQIAMANDVNYMTADEHIDGEMKKFESCIEKIVLSINSSGGYVDSGMALVNVIESSKIPVEAHVHWGASMAFVIIQSCHVRKMYKRGRIMWHNISSGVQGDHETMKETVKQMEQDKKLIDSLILDRTKLSEKDLKSIYRAKKDKYFYAEECIKMELIDEMI